MNINFNSVDDECISFTRFPDGQLLATLKYVDSPVLLSGSICSFDDVQKLLVATTILRNHKIDDINLILYYVLGSRSDRPFQENGIDYVSQIISPIINSMNYNSVNILDPHSGALTLCIDNSKSISPSHYVFGFIKDFNKETTAIVAPDKGAFNRANEAANFCGIKKVYTAKKVRDTSTGNIISSSLDDTYFNGVDDLIILDDICDGGRTFLELAIEIRKHYSKKLHLYVTHGIFSKGLRELSLTFDSIMTTDSYLRSTPDFFLYNDKFTHKLKIKNL